MRFFGGGGGRGGLGVGGDGVFGFLFFCVGFFVLCCVVCIYMFLFQLIHK